MAVCIRFAHKIAAFKRKHCGKQTAEGFARSTAEISAATIYRCCDHERIPNLVDNKRRICLKFHWLLSLV